MLLFLFFNTNNAYWQHDCYVLNNLKSLAGFEPGTFVHEADGMSTAPRRHSYCNVIFLVLLSDTGK
jgi:hypothetical protein